MTEPARDAQDPNNTDAQQGYAAEDEGITIHLPDETNDPRDHWLWAAFLVILSLVAFAPAIPGSSFIWDDDRYPQNPAVMNGAQGLYDIWFAPSQPPAGESAPGRYTTPQYYPLTFTTFWLEYQLWGDNPTGYHAVNALIHAGGALLLWEILRRLGVPGAWVAAAVFAVHPLQAESVAWITERKNTLAGAFFFGSIFTYLKFAGVNDGPGAASDPARSPDAKPDWQWYFTALGLFVAAILSKTIACSMPVVVAILLWWKRPESLKRHLPLLLPFLVLGAAAGAVTGWFEYHIVRAQGPEWEHTLPEHLTIAGRVIGHYAYKVFLPLRLMFMYPRWEPSGSDALGWAGLAAAVVAVAVAFALRNKLGRALAAALLIYLVTLVPAMGFVNVYPMKYSFVADHFQYLSGVALMVLVVGAAAHLVRTSIAAEPTRRTAGIVLAAAVLVPLTAISYAHSSIFVSNEKLWRDTAEKNPTLALAHYNLAVELLRQAEADLRELSPEIGRKMATDKSTEAIEQLQATLALRPNDEASANAYNNWGRALRLLRKPEEALEKFNQSLALKDNVLVRNNLGVAYRDLGRPEEAKAQYARALELNPRSQIARYNLGSILFDQARDLDARAARAAAIASTQPGAATQSAVAATTPSTAPSVAATGPTTTPAPAAVATTGPLTEPQRLAMEARKFYDEARVQFVEAVKLRPESGDTWYKLGITLAQLGRREQAFQALNEAIKQKPTLGEAHAALGALYWLNGQLNEAGVAYTNAVKLQPENPEYYATLGFLAGQLGKYKQAEEFFQAALKVDPKNFRAQQGLAAIQRAATQPTTRRSSTTQAAPASTNAAAPAADAAAAAIAVPATAPASQPVQ